MNPDTYRRETYEHFVRMSNILGWQRSVNADEHMMRFVNNNPGRENQNWIELPYGMDHLRMVETLTRGTLELLP